VTERSFQDFVAEQSTGLLRIGFLLTNDRSRGRDLLQLALIAVHRHGDELADPPAYARQQLVRAATGWQQRLRVGDLLGESSLLAGTTGLPGFNAGAPVDPGPRTELATALAALPPRARAALVLRYGADLTEAATADALNTSVAETREVLLLGLQRLRELVPGDDALDARLRADLTARAADVTADPRQATALALEGARDRRRHLAGLAAVAGFVVLVVLVVALTV
jgi:DNA-directed RNA polymerase specialized sigma24 family protein